MQCYYCEDMKFYGAKVPLPFYTNNNDSTLFIGLYFENEE